MAKVRDRRSRGWFWMDNEIIDAYGSELGAYALVVYAVLSRYANNDTASAQISIGKIAERSGMSAASVKRALRKLEGAGLVGIEHRYSGEWQHASEYILRAPGQGGQRDPGSEGPGVTQTRGLTEPEGGSHRPGGGSVGATLIKTTTERLQSKDCASRDSKWVLLAGIMSEIRSSPHAPSEQVELGMLAGADLAAVRERGIWNQELDRLEQERSRR